MKKYKLQTLFIFLLMCFNTIQSLGQYKLSLAAGTGSSSLISGSKSADIDHWNSEGQVSSDWLGFAELHYSLIDNRFGIDLLLGYKFLGYELNGSEVDDNSLTWTSRSVTQRFRGHGVYSGLSISPYSFKITDNHIFKPYLRLAIGLMVIREQTVNEQRTNRYGDTEETFYLYERSQLSEDGNFLPESKFFFSPALGIRYYRSGSKLSYSIFTDLQYHRELESVSLFSSFGDYLEFRIGVVFDVFYSKSKD